MMKVAAYQAPLLPAGAMDVVELIAAEVRSCEAAGVQLLCCPEGVLGGLADSTGRPNEIALGVRDGELERILAPIASETVTTIVGFTERGDAGRWFNTAAIVHQGRVTGLYRKRHPAIRRSVYEPGTETPIFECGGLTFGVAICRDSTFADLITAIAAQGATALFVPANNGLPPAKGPQEIADSARATDIARARENGIAVIRADVAGRADGLVSCGSSGIVDRTGRVLQSAKPFDVGLLIAEV